MVKQNGQTHSNNSSTICRRIECDHFVKLALKGLICESLSCHKTTHTLTINRLPQGSLKISTNDWTGMLIKFHTYSRPYFRRKERPVIERCPFILFLLKTIQNWVRLNYPTTHHQPKYIHRYPPPAKIYPPPLTTTHHQPKYIHQHPPHPPTAKTFFIRNPFIRISSHCLTATQET